MEVTEPLDSFPAPYYSSRQGRIDVLEVSLEKERAVTTYVIRLSHPPDQCPSSNSKVRELIAEVGPSIPKIGERVGVKIVTGPLVLGAEHEGLAVLEADRPEAVNDFLLETGLVQWNSVRVSMAQALPDALAELDKAPPALY